MITDILDPDSYVHDVPHQRFAELRREAPVCWLEERDGPGCWNVLRYRDVVRVLKDAQVFSSEVAGTQIADLPEGDFRRSPDVLANMDPPKHTRYRNLISHAFTRHGLSRVEPYIEKVVAARINEVVERQRFDFVQDFAARLPMDIILTMVGVPREAHDSINDWVMRLLATDDPEYATTHEERQAITARFMEYAHALADERRHRPKDDLLSVLMAAEVDGVKLSDTEFALFFMLLLGAGTDTSRLLLGSGLQALLATPQLWAELARAPERIGGAVEETLRYAPPLMHFRRTATRDVDLAGARILKGQKVVVWLVSANRDEDVFADPDRFDIARGATDHLSFGHGPHFCVGNALARLTARIALGQCVRRLQAVELTGPVERVRSNWFNGMKRMQVTVCARR